MTRSLERPRLALDSLVPRLAELSVEVDATPAWPETSLEACIAQGVMGWFVERRYGGQAWSTREITEGLLGIGGSCLTTAFVLTQLTAAIRRIAASPNAALALEWLPRLARGERLATVGISHLTTSRRHLGQPALRAERIDGGFRIEGYTPWVTGASHVQGLVTGAELPDGHQLLALLPADATGVQCDPPARLVGLSSSCTSTVRFHRVEVPESNVLAGPRPGVLQFSQGQTGGLQTSTLALALATAAVDHLRNEALLRRDLGAIAQQFDTELRRHLQHLRRLADGETGSPERLRERANSLVLRATQASLVASKGAGFVDGHPAGRWCREALFFLVWSCPQAVADANLMELAACADDDGENLGD